MRLPMYIMSLLCVCTGVFYDLVNKYLLHPATDAALNVTNYVDKMMGEGYSAAHGVQNIAVEPVKFSFWNPIIWLVLFGVLFIAAALVILGGRNERGNVLSAGASSDAKYDTFFSGEKELYSQVGGSDLFWGFKTNWKGYYKIMEALHSGIVNDYASMAVVGTAIICLCMFVFMR